MPGKRMARIFWDTNLFIYLFENNAEWSPRVVEFRQRMRQRRDELLGVRCHHHMDRAAVLDQQTGQIDRTMGRNRPRDAQNDRFAFHRI